MTFLYKDKIEIPDLTLKLVSFCFIQREERYGFDSPQQSRFPRRKFNTRMGITRPHQHTWFSPRHWSLM